jgi:hypothetical protein
MLISKRKSMMIFAIVAIIILIIAGFGILNKYLPELDGADMITLEDNTAYSGEPFELHLTTTASGGIVIFPNNVLVERDGIFRNETYYNFTGQSPTIRVLIPPSLSEFSIDISSGSAHETFEILVENGAAPLVSGASYYDHEATLVRRFNNRNVGSPQVRAAADHYNSFFNQLGFESEIREYQKQDGVRTYDVLDVIAFKWGAEYPDEWIVLGGHYDIARRSIEGAFDNGGGATAVVELAKGFSKITTSRTLVFCMWDGEEKGLWGSNFFAQEIPEDVDVKVYLNFDMVGLNWPLPYDLVVLMGPNPNEDSDDCPHLISAATKAAFNYLGYPEAGIDIRESSGGGSDHLSFQKIGTQTYFFIGNVDYIQYHRRTDLLIDMVAYAGGRSNLEAGFATVAWMAFYITILLDNNNDLHQGEAPSN